MRSASSRLLLQAKLLRVLEDQVIRRVGGVRDMQVDVRVIAASNRDLERAVREGQFRQDLYYRLAIISIFIPPLRERKEDILPLADFFIDHYNKKFRKSIQRPDRGNSPLAAELRLAGKRAGTEKRHRTRHDPGGRAGAAPRLSCPFRSPNRLRRPAVRPSSKPHRRPSGGRPLANGRWLPPLTVPEGGTSLEEVERALLELALQKAGENQTHAARLLDISRDALRYKMKKFGLIHAEEEEEANVRPESTA